MLYANARMYSVTPAVKAAWDAVLAWAIRQAKLDWKLLDHPAPAPMSALWGRNDLGMAMMCGLPYSERKPRPTLVAAPIPSPARYGARPVYFTDIAVRADSAFQSLEDTFGHKVGYTLHESMSGYAALRRHLLPHRRERPLYSSSVGGLQSARAVIEALADGRIDAGPLDSYSYDLLRANDAAFAAKVRVVDTTQPAPIPPLIATAPVADADLRKLREALRDVAAAPELAAQRRMLLLKGFAIPAETDYDVFASVRAAADSRAGEW
ncbi:MAG TPA: PhnD/SsuA/transferrin family substrate-binding protein [Burkholderiales bacterium]|nr:PhnD/SsuA/transferrin family substrate-binding protein [Burkholderiales bacterium]